jgi:DNA polymerase III delta prime subunit
MSIKDKIFWEKYRPNTLTGMILLPRIERLIKDGIQMNLIFYGTSGTGKTTLANILSKEYNFLKLNASDKNGIDILRSKIETYLNTMILGGKDGLKVIYLDEFDRATPQLQDGLKSFTETYENRARFIFTTNHISKITKELRSRFTEVPFDPIDKTERDYLYKKHVSYIRAIAKKENFEKYTEVEPFVKIVNKYFPDLRKSIQAVQEAIITGNIDNINITTGSDKIDFYKYLCDKNTNPIDIYDYVMNNFFTNFEDAYEYLGRQFFEYLREYKNEFLINNGAAILNTQKSYNETYPVTPDPIIHLINYILEIKTILMK